MTLKASFFDRTVFFRALKKVFFTAAVYTLIWMMIQPFSLPSVYEAALRARNTIDGYVGYQLGGEILQSVGETGGVLSFVYGFLLAWLIYFWLFRTTTAYHIASLPVRREALFVTNYIAGLLAFLVPHLLVALTSCVVSSCLGYPQLTACLQWFAMLSLECLFFYSFSVLLIMVVGHVAAMPAVYLILNLAVYAVYTVVSALMKKFVYGMPQYIEGSGDVTVLFSPLYALINGYGPKMTYNVIYDEAASAYLNAEPLLLRWQYAVGLGVIGVIFAVLAFFLLRRREMERCGDVISVRWLRPVFLYAFTIGCALILGEIIMQFIPDMRSNSFTLTMLFLFIGAFLGYFAAQMMLKKTVHVFGRGWLGLSVCCLVLLALFGAARLDLTGYSSRIPTAEQVESVTLDFGTYYLSLSTTNDAQTIDDVISLHETILENRSAQQKLSRSSEPLTSRCVTLCYTLKDGTTLQRFYELYALTGDMDESNPLIQFAQTYNTLPFVLARTLPDFTVTEKNIATCRLSGVMKGTDNYDSTYLSTQQAYDFFTGCVLPDLADSSLGREVIEDLPTTQPVHTASAESSSELSSCYIELMFISPEGQKVHRSMDIPYDATRILTYMDELGFDVGWNKVDADK